MARTALTKQAIVQAGLSPSYAAANVDGHSFEGSGRVFLHVKNTNVAARTVTIQTPATVAGLAVAEQPVEVPATSGDAMIGPFDPHAFNRPVDGADAGKVYVDFSAVVDVTVALLGF